VLTWWPLVLTVLAAVAAVVGFTIPSRVGGHWLALAALVLLGVVLFVAVYRLHQAAFPDFPKHRVSFGNPMYVSHDDGMDDFVLLDLTFTNRHERRVNLFVELWWEWEDKVEGGGSLGPYKCREVKGPIGQLELTGQPVDVGPEVTVPAELAFSVDTAFGIHAGTYHDVTLEPGMKVWVRLTDWVSDASIDCPLSLQTNARKELKQRGGG
jgi:hypothetical protein